MPGKPSKPAYKGGRTAVICRTHKRIVAFMDEGMDEAMHKWGWYGAKGCAVTSAIVYNGDAEAKPHA